MKMRETKLKPEIREIADILRISAEVIYEGDYYFVALIGKKENFFNGEITNHAVYGYGTTLLDAFVYAFKNLKWWQRNSITKLLDKNGEKVVLPEFETLEELKLKLLVGTI